MDINTEIAVQPGGIRFTGIAGIGIRILFSGATEPTPRKYQQHENSYLNDNANHGSPPLWNESLQPRAIRGGLNSLGDRSSCCFDLSFRCASPKESQRVTQPSSHLFARTGGNYYCMDTRKRLVNAASIGKVPKKARVRFSGFPGALQLRLLN